MKQLLTLILLVVVLTSFSHAQIYSETFEDGLDNWDGDWSLSTTQAYSPENSLADSPGQYGNWSEEETQMITGVDLSEVQSAELHLWTYCDVEEYFDFWYIYITADDGEHWDLLEEFTGDSAMWHELIYDIGSYAGQSDVKLRFQIMSDGSVSRDGVYIDDIRIYEADVDVSPPLVQHNPVPINEAVAEDYNPVFIITDIHDVEYAELYYTADGGPETEAEFVEQVDNEYHFTIPSYLAGTRVEYWLEVSDTMVVPNEGTAGPWSYLCGTMIDYIDDIRSNDMVVTYNNNNRIANLFEVEGQTYLAGLYFLYRMQLDSIDIMVWDNDDAGNPNDTLELMPEPLAIYPDNTIENPVVWTYVDLRDYVIPVDESFHGGAIFRSTHPNIMYDNNNGIYGRRDIGGGWQNFGDNYFIRAVVGDIFAEESIDVLQTDPTLIGSMVKTRGIVTQEPGALFTNRSELYIQDETGYGIQLFTWDDIVDVWRGDEIEVSGRLAESNGVTRIEDFTYEILASGNPMPDPIIFSTGEIADYENMEGSWAQSTGILLEQPENDFGIFHIEDGTGACRVRVWGNPGIPMTNFNRFDAVTFSGVISIEGNDVQLLPSDPNDIAEAEMIINPTFLTASLDELTGLVELEWSMSSGTIAELAYENGNMVQEYWPLEGNSYGNHMSPEGTCQVLTLKYFTTGTEDFSPALYGFDGEPVVDQDFSTTATALDSQWIEIDIEDEGFVYDGDFVVAFGGMGTNAGLMAEDIDVGRSWRRIDGEWSEMNWVTFGMRAVVRYRDGTVATLAPNNAGSLDELDSFTGFNVYRNGNIHDTVTDPVYVDTLEDAGEYVYTITASYDEGDSEHSNEVTIFWEGSGIDDGVTDNSLPTRFGIEKVYPNPFNPSIQIVLGITELSNVKVSIFDILGRTVQVLSEDKFAPGFHAITWNATGKPSGIYFVNMTSNSGTVDMKKVVYVK